MASEPDQVAARTAEFIILRRIHPIVSARIAAALHPIGASALLILGPAGASLFAALYGAGNGLLTIARGTLPLALFGPFPHRALATSHTLKIPIGPVDTQSAS